jgi:uroporphyrinogen-III synthase
LREAGIAPIVPERYRLGALIRLVSDQLTSAHARRFVCGDTPIELRGRVVTVNGRSVTLGPHALALFTALSETDAVLSRSELIQCLPDELDDHALEVAVSRLRRTLNVPGLITTVVKRGYRFNAVRLSPPPAPATSDE